jgi:hypothetical protein
MYFGFKSAISFLQGDPVSMEWPEYLTIAHSLAFPSLVEKKCLTIEISG